MSTINVGKIKSHIFDKSLVVSFSKDWLLVNAGQPLEFEAKIKEGRLVLSAKLETLDRTKEVDTNEM